MIGVGSAFQADTWCACGAARCQGGRGAAGLQVGFKTGIGLRFWADTWCARVAAGCRSGRGIAGLQVG